MPDLTTCTDSELRELLPGIGGRLQEQGDSFSINWQPLRAYAAAIRKNVDQGIIPGFCSLVLWGDCVLHSDSYGFADLETGQPMQSDTIARIYCMGKCVVASALMILVEQSRCSLEDAVKQFIPSFGNTAGGRCMTLRHLLTHCSGLGYGKEFNLQPETPAEEAYQALVEDVESGKVASLEDFCNRLAEAPLTFDPGSRFEYSYGLDVIGRVIEVVSEQRLDVFLEEKLFKPLGMVDTGFCVPSIKLSRLAGLYAGKQIAQALGQTIQPKRCLVRRPKPEADWALHRIDGSSAAESAWVEGKHCAVLSGGGFMGHNQGGLVSTVNDFACFCLMIANHGQLPGGPRVLKEETVKDMVSHDWLQLPTCLGKVQVNAGVPGVTASGQFGWNCLGELGTVQGSVGDNEFEEGEYGYAGIAETFWSINPKRKLIIIWFTQQVDNHSWSTASANLWLASRKALQEAQGPPAMEELSRLTRTARSQSPGLPQQRKRLRRKSKLAESVSA